jgi:hypothetical protein
MGAQNNQPDRSSDETGLRGVPRARLGLKTSGTERNCLHVDSHLSSGPVEEVRVGRDRDRSIEHHGGGNGLRGREVQLTVEGPPSPARVPEGFIKPMLGGRISRESRTRIFSASESPSTARENEPRPGPATARASRQYHVPVVNTSPWSAASMNRATEGS